MARSIAVATDRQLASLLPVTCQQYAPRRGSHASASTAIIVRLDHSRAWLCPKILAARDTGRRHALLIATAKMLAIRHGVRYPFDDR